MFNRITSTLHTTAMVAQSTKQRIKIRKEILKRQQSAETAKLWEAEEAERNSREYNPADCAQVWA